LPEDRGGVAPLRRARRKQEMVAVLDTQGMMPDENAM